MSFDQILLWGCCPLSADSAGEGGGGGGLEGAHVPSNTEYFNVLLEVGGLLGMPMTYYPYSSSYLLLPLLLPLPTIPLVHGVR